MGISLLQPLPIGNAVRVFVTPPTGAAYWRILRRTANIFTGANDTGAVLVADACVDNSVLDIAALENGTTYFWAVYFFVSGAWVAGGVSSAVPAASYGSITPDPLTVVRRRVELGLAAEVKRGALKPASGAIRVVTAPYALPDKPDWPVVSVHVDQDAPSDRGIGEILDGPEQLVDGTWQSSEGWISAVTLGVVGISTNSDERIALRQALKRIVVGNLPVFDAAGMVQIGFSQSDEEDFESANVTLFRTVGTFTCLAPFVVTSVDQAITDVDITVTTYPENLNYVGSYVG